MQSFVLSIIVTGMCADLSWVHGQSELFDILQIYVCVPPTASKQKFGPCDLYS